MQRPNTINSPRVGTFEPAQPYFIPLTPDYTSANPPIPTPVYQCYSPEPVPRGIHRHLDTPSIYRDENRERAWPPPQYQNYSPPFLPPHQFPILSSPFREYPPPTRQEQMRATLNRYRLTARHGPASTHTDIRVERSSQSQNRNHTHTQTSISAVPSSGNHPATSQPPAGTRRDRGRGRNGTRATLPDIRSSPSMNPEYRSDDGGNRADSPHPDSQAYDQMCRHENEEDARRIYQRQRNLADGANPHNDRSNRAEVDSTRSSSPPSVHSDGVDSRRRRRRQPRERTPEEDEHPQSRRIDEVRMLESSRIRPTSYPPRTVPLATIVRSRTQVDSPRTQPNTAMPRQPSSSTNNPLRRRDTTGLATEPPQGHGRDPPRLKLNISTSVPGNAITSTGPVAPSQRNTKDDKGNCSSATPHKSASPAVRRSETIVPMVPRSTQFEDDLEEEMICPICMSVMVAPHQVTPCGHSLCGGCGVQWIMTRVTTGDRVNCPTCRKAVDPKNPLIPARVVENMIRKWIQNKIASTGEWEGMADFKEREECWNIHKDHSPDSIIPTIPSEVSSTVFPVPSGLQPFETEHGRARISLPPFSFLSVVDRDPNTDAYMNTLHGPGYTTLSHSELRGWISGGDRMNSGTRNLDQPSDLISRIDHFFGDHHIPREGGNQFRSGNSPQPTVREPNRNRRLPRVDTSPQYLDVGLLEEMLERERINSQVARDG